MGRENMADYNADFLTMLQTWDAAVQHLESGSVNNPQAIEITNLLGWTQDRSYRDAAVNYLTSRDVTDIQPIELTRLLGWTPKRTLGA